MKQNQIYIKVVLTQEPWTNVREIRHSMSMMCYVLKHFLNNNLEI